MLGVWLLLVGLVLSVGELILSYHRPELFLEWGLLLSRYWSYPTAWRECPFILIFGFGLAAFMSWVGDDDCKHPAVVTILALCGIAINLVVISRSRI